VAPLPERVAATGPGLPAGRIDYAALTRTVEAALTSAFGAPENGAAWTVRDSYGYRLLPTVLAARGVYAGEARRVIKTALLRSPQVAFAWTREEILGALPGDVSYLEGWRLSYHAERSQDVIFSPPPYFVDRAPFGSNHGTPYHYDSHIPLLWYGAGVPRRVIAERVGSDAVAPTLARVLGIPAPPRAEAQPLF
jgi:hypothetical protein